MLYEINTIKLLLSTTMPFSEIQNCKSNIYINISK